jgi:hypothetical protein
MKGVETVAVKVCSALVGSEDKARMLTRPRARVCCRDQLLSHRHCSLIDEIAGQHMRISTARPR